MSIFQIARKPPQWLRVVLAGLLLAFAINSMAHAAHRHDAKTTAAHIATCGFSATFDNITDVPAFSITIEAAPAESHLVPIVAVGRVSCRPLTHAQPRAPPAI
jgi:hypothetical protein